MSEGVAQLPFALGCLMLVLGTGIAVPDPGNVLGWVLFLQGLGLVLGTTLPVARRRLGER